MAASGTDPVIQVVDRQEENIRALLGRFRRLRLAANECYGPEQSCG